MISFADNSYIVEVTFDHSGLKDGMERLRAAVDAAEGFPQPSEKAHRLVQSAALSARALEEATTKRGRSLLAEHMHYSPIESITFPES